MNKPYLCGSKFTKKARFTKTNAEKTHFYLRKLHAGGPFPYTFARTLKSYLFLLLSCKMALAYPEGVTQPSQGQRPWS